MRYLPGLFWRMPGLFIIIYYECPDDSGHPSAEGKEEDDKYRAASLVNYCERRTEDAYQDTEDTHWDCRLSI